jgi:hypothetical protein
MAKMTDSADNKAASCRTVMMFPDG